MMACCLHRAGLVCDHQLSLRRGLQCGMQTANAEHLGGLRQPFARSVQRAAHTAIGLRLERVGQWQCQQAAHRIILARSHEGSNL